MSSIRYGFLGFPRRPVDGPVLLAALNAAGSTFIDFKAGINQKYDRYEIEFNGLLVTTNAADLQFRASIDGGANFLSGTEYFYLRSYVVSSAVTTPVANGAASAAQVVLGNSLNNGANNIASGVIQLFRLPGFRTELAWQIVYVDNAGNLVAGTGGGSVGVNEVNAFRLLCSSGGFISGMVKLRAYPAVEQFVLSGP